MDIPGFIILERLCVFYSSQAAFSTCVCCLFFFFIHPRRAPWWRKASKNDTCILLIDHDYACLQLLCLGDCTEDWVAEEKCRASSQD